MSPFDKELILISRICPELRPMLVRADDCPSKNQVYNRVADGLIPVVQDMRPYRIRRSDLPLVAEVFGIELRKDAA